VLYLHSIPLFVVMTESRSLQISKYCNVAAAAFLVQDYFLTLESEVSWAVRKRWSLPRGIFTVARYVPFIGTGLALASALDNSVLHCSWYAGNGTFMYLQFPLD